VVGVATAMPGPLRFYESIGMKSADDTNLKRLATSNQNRSDLSFFQNDPLCILCHDSVEG